MPEIKKAYVTLLGLGAIFFVTRLVWADASMEDYQAGVTQYQQRQYQKAADLFNSAIQLNPNIWQNYEMLGEAYYQLHQNDKALTAVEQSLKLHPDNPQLEAFNNRLLVSNAIAPAPTPKPTVIFQGSEVQSPSSSAPTGLEKVATVAAPEKWWIKAYGGYDYSFLGDVITGVKNWKSFYEDVVVPATFSTGNSGYEVGLEGGWNLDQDNALALSVENINTQNEGYSYATPTGGNNTWTLGPSLQSVSLNYYRTMLKGNNNKTCIMVGGGLYNATVNLSTTGGAGGDSSNDYTGDVLGGTAGLSEELKIGKNFTLGFSVKGRLATFDKVTATSLRFNGQVQTLGAPYSLMISTLASPPGVITAASPSLVGNEFRYAVVDYSGLSGDFSVSYEF